MAEKKTRKKISRREFLKDAAVLGGTVVGGGILAGCAPEAPTAVPTLAPPTPAPPTATPVPPTAVPPTPQVIVKEVQVALQKAMGHIERNVDTCAGCRTCEAVCTLSHDGVVSPALARTWIIDYIVEGRRIEGYTCKQCNAPNCLQACPAKAIYVDAKTGARVIDPKKCVGSKLCIKACPQYPNSPIKFDAGKKISVKCDLCATVGGDPLCVKYCPESSLSLVKEA